MKQNNLVIKISTVFFLAITVYASSAQKPKEKNYFLKFTPPGTAKISTSLYFDKTEITNLDYVEYISWNERVFGKKSNEYITSLPDTNFWLTKEKCLHTLTKNYLRHPAYRDYPALGISSEQAINYSKWRSDRVFEWMLISFGKLKMNPDQSKENYFSIDNYFNGLYNNQKPDTTIIWIPNYYLPKNSDYNNAMLFIDSLSFLNNTIYFDTVPISNNYCKNDTLNHLPFSPCGMTFNKKKSTLILNLFDNVSELSFTNNASNDEDLNFKELLLKYPSDYVGFRNAFRWIKYENRKK